MSFYENGLTFSLIHWYPLPSHAVKQGHRQWLIPWNRNGGTRLNIDMHTQDTCSCQHKWLFSSSSLHSIHLLVRPSISLQNVLCKTARRLLVIISSGLKISLKPSVLMIMRPQWFSSPPSIVQEKKTKNPKNKNKKNTVWVFWWHWTAAFLETIMAAIHWLVPLILHQGRGPTGWMCGYTLGKSPVCCRAVETKRPPAQTLLLLYYLFIYFNYYLQYSQNY